MNFLPFREMPIGGGGQATFPFNTIGSGQNNVLVQSNGSLLNSLRPDDKIPIAGFDQYFQVQDGDIVWLELQFNAGGVLLPQPDGAQINHGNIGVFNPAASAWTTHAYVELDPTNTFQQYSKTLIAQVSISGESVVVNQKCTTNLILNDSCIDFIPAKFPIPAPYAPYIAP